LLGNVKILKQTAKTCKKKEERGPYQQYLHQTTPLLVVVKVKLGYKEYG
jgi:hypothetical protein